MVDKKNVEPTGVVDFHVTVGTLQQTLVTEGLVGILVQVTEFLRLAHLSTKALGDAPTIHELVRVAGTAARALGVVYDEVAADLAVGGSFAGAVAQTRRMTTFAGIHARAAVRTVTNCKKTNHFFNSTNSRVDRDARRFLTLLACLAVPAQSHARMRRFLGTIALANGTLVFHFVRLQN